MILQERLFATFLLTYRNGTKRQIILNLIDRPSPQSIG